MRKAAKRDKNEREIIETLTAIGCTVQQLSAKGVPDLLVGFQDPETGQPTNLLMEIKDKGGTLTPDQVAWINTWEGQVYVVYTVQEALLAVGR